MKFFCPLGHDEIDSNRGEGGHTPQHELIEFAPSVPKTNTQGLEILFVTMLSFQNRAFDK